MGVGEIGFGKMGRELPGVSDAARFERGLNRVLAVEASEFVFIVWRLERGTDCFFALGEETAVLRADECAARGLSQAGQAITKCGCGTPGRGGRIVKFVSEAGGKFAQSGELLVLLFGAG